MPKVEKGSLLVPVEKLLEYKPGRLDWAVRCSCILVDEPFTAIVVVDDKRLPMAIGSGSLICPRECGDEIDVETWELGSPAWARGVLLSDEPCPSLGDRELLSAIEGVTGLRFAEADSATVLEEGGVAAHPRSLDLEVVGESCGRAQPLLPHHPLAAFFAAEPSICVASLVEPVRGSKWWGGVPLAVLAAGRAARRVLAYRYGVVRGRRPEALLLAALPGERGEKELLLAYALGVLHACGLAE